MTMEQMQAGAEQAGLLRCGSEGMVLCMAACCWSEHELLGFWGARSSNCMSQLRYVYRLDPKEGRTSLATLRKAASYMARMAWGH